MTCPSHPSPRSFRVIAEFQVAGHYRLKMVFSPTGSNLFPDRWELCFSEIRKEKKNQEKQAILWSLGFFSERSQYEGPEGTDRSYWPRPISPGTCIPFAHRPSNPFKLRLAVQSLLGVSCRYAGLQSCLWSCLLDGHLARIVTFSSALSLALSHLVPDRAPWRDHGPGSPSRCVWGCSQIPFPAQTITRHAPNYTLSVGILSVLGLPLTPGLSSSTEAGPC